MLATGGTIVQVVDRVAGRQGGLAECGAGTEVVRGPWLGGWMAVATEKQGW